MRAAIIFVAFVLALAACHDRAPAFGVVEVADEHSYSTAADRFVNPGGDHASLTIERGEAATYALDCFASRWRLIAPSAEPSTDLRAARSIDLDDASGMLNDVRAAGALLTLRPHDGQAVVVTGVAAPDPCLAGEVVIIRNLAPREPQ